MADQNFCGGKQTPLWWRGWNPKQKAVGASTVFYSFETIYEYNTAKKELSKLIHSAAPNFLMWPKYTAAPHASAQHNMSRCSG